MNKRQWLIILMMSQFILFYVSITYILPSLGTYFIPQYIVLMILFTILSKSKGFVLLIAYTLTIGIGYLVLGFIKVYDISSQWQLIFYHLTFVINAAIMYTTSYFFQSLEQENTLLSKRVSELEDYVGTSRLLTKHEFEKRSNLIKIAMNRRGEEGYQIYFSLEKIDSHVQKSAFDTLTSLALTIFRSDYDLVGKWDDNSFALLLQNTDEVGMEIALNRYLDKVKSKMNLKESDLVIKIEYIGLVHQMEMTT